MSQYYIGLMSGTSADAIDAVLVDLEGGIHILAQHNEPIPDSTRQEIIALTTPGDNEVDRMGRLDTQLGKMFANAANRVIQDSGLSPGDIVAIGSHGQTIRHRPPSGVQATPGFTVQIADPNTIALQTGITTVADFRRRDLAAGGQGAPLAPAFHDFISPKDCSTVGFLNLGGIANITLVHEGKLLLGFDTGPANGLMDGWIQRHQNKRYDHNGSWSASGSCDQELLALLLDEPFFRAAPPKSTGKEYFNLAWLDSKLSSIGRKIEAADVQATLVQLTAHSVALAIRLLPHSPEKIYYCGGGALNPELVNALAMQLDGVEWRSTAELGVDPQWLEACAFAWFAQRTLQKQTLPLARCSGASHNTIAGAVYYAG